MRKLFALCALCSALCSCGGIAARLDDVRDSYATGNYEIKSAPESNLDLLIAGNSYFQAGEFAKSDAAFEQLRLRGIDSAGTSIGGEAAKLAGGQMAGDYKPYMMDQLFVSYYQLWDALAAGRWADARVIINQSYSRQQGMSREYKKLIEGRQSSRITKELNLSQWAAYGDIMNPALTYLAGVYFLNDGDFETARTYLARAAGMAPDNDYIAADLALARSGGMPDDIAWVFIESGFAPKLVESRLDLPLVGAGQVVSVAVSKPVPFVSMPAVDNAELLADVDAMFMTEYKEYSGNEAGRAFAKAAANAALQYAAGQAGSLAQIGAMVFSIGTTAAEIRTWAGLPKQIFLLRAQKDKSGLIKIATGGKVLKEINLPANGNNLVYIRFLGNNINEKVVGLK